MSMTEGITFNLELNVEQSMAEVRRLETLLFRTLGLARRLGLPEDISRQVYAIQRAIMIIRMLHSAYNLLMASTGPIGWMLGAVGFASAIVSCGDLVMEF